MRKKIVSVLITLCLVPVVCLSDMDCCEFIEPDGLITMTYTLWVIAGTNYYLDFEPGIIALCPRDF